MVYISLNNSINNYQNNGPMLKEINLNIVDLPFQISLKLMIKMKNQIKLNGVTKLM